MARLLQAFADEERRSCEIIAGGCLVEASSTGIIQDRFRMGNAEKKETCFHGLGWRWLALKN